MDVSGEHHLDVLHSVFKTRLGENGQPIQEDTEQYELGASKEGEDGQQEGDKVEGKLEEKVLPKDVKTGGNSDKCGRYALWVRSG